PNLLHAELTEGEADGKLAGLASVAVSPAALWTDPDAPLAMAVTHVDLLEPGCPDQSPVGQAFNCPGKVARVAAAEKFLGVVEAVWSPRPVGQVAHDLGIRERLRDRLRISRPKGTQLDQLSTDVH